MSGNDVIAATIASMTSGRRPSLKFGTHSTIRFIDQLPALEHSAAKIHRRMIGNLTIVVHVVDGNVRLFARFERAETVLTAYRRGAVDCRRCQSLCRSHAHLRTC